MAYNVVIKNHVQASNIDTFNRAAIATVDIENGGVCNLTHYSTNEGEGMVWVAEEAGAATAAGLWMVHSPEIPIVKDAMGVEYKGIQVDPRAFINGAGRVMDVFKLCEGDIIEMTGEGITGIDTNAYLIPAATGFKLVSSATAGTGLCLHKVGTGKLHVANASLVKTPVATYKYEVVNN